METIYTGPNRLTAVLEDIVTDGQSGRHDVAALRQAAEDLARFGQNADDAVAHLNDTVEDSDGDGTDV
ncbi:hypothetical protein [Streptomyces sp. MZ04]|uniref:hypothetical protein n=1 Tax=Streptomyces sp. MZ04 TaxID=2559236 RepID=UPI001432F2E5|nr:hypothetical protein [Streptomyces sp. MZ04]